MNDRSEDDEVTREEEDEPTSPPVEESNAEEGSPPLPAEELVPGNEEEGEEDSETQVLEEELGLLEAQLHDMRNRYLRAAADLDNARKRARREMKEAQRRAAGGVLLDVLTVVDSFELALNTAGKLSTARGEVKALYDGMALIYRQLMNMLERRGVKPIPAVGEQFDPTRHEAVAQVPAAASQGEGVVALETQKGYFFGDQVLRPSKVGVTVHIGQKGERG